MECWAIRAELICARNKLPRLIIYQTQHLIWPPFGPIILVSAAAGDQHLAIIGWPQHTPQISSCRVRALYTIHTITDIEIVEFSNDKYTITMFKRQIIISKIHHKGYYNNDLSNLVWFTYLPVSYATSLWPALLSRWILNIIKAV